MKTKIILRSTLAAAAIALTLNGAAVSLAVADQYKENTHKLYHKRYHPKHLHAAVSPFPEGHCPGPSANCPRHGPNKR
jgi:hypothetical protein